MAPVLDTQTTTKAKTRDLIALESSLIKQVKGAGIVALSPLKSRINAMSPGIQLPTTTSPKTKDVRETRNSVQFLDMASKKRSLFGRTLESQGESEKKDDAF